MGGLAWQGQQSFAAGAYPLQERTPPNAVEDCVNGLFDDDGSIYKRGGGAYKGTAFAESLLSVWDVALGGGQRTLGLSSDAIYQLGADDATPATVMPTSAGFAGMLPRRLAVVKGIAGIPLLGSGLAQVLLFAGSRRTWAASYSTGTIAVTQGSTTVTGSGTSWNANVDAGSVLFVSSQGVLSAVRSVDSNTQLTLASPWVGTTATGLSYEVDQSSGVAVGVGSLPIVAAAGNRLLAAVGSVIKFSHIGNPYTFDATDYHDIGDGIVTGLQGVGNSALVFSTTGVEQIRSLSFNLTDALGNVQQTLSDEGHDVVLWGGPGLVGIDGGVLIPAIDDLYTFSGGQIQRFNALGMRKQWRAYVKAGYTLGNAAVHRGHYLLPILDSAGTTVQDVLVVRLDTGAWGRWSGHSAGVSFAQRGATSTAPPKLLAAKGTRLLDLTGCFEPSASNKNDADGSTPTWQVTCRTVADRTAKDLLKKVRVRAELDDAATDNPTIGAEVAIGRPGSSFAALSGTIAANNGQTPYTWPSVNVRGTEFRVRLTSSGPSAKLVLRSVEYAIRQRGRD